jgi:phosphonoacetaldehyde hydrolase
MSILYVSSSASNWLPSIRAVVLDWAGTTIDFGSVAPVRVFREVFRDRGIDVTEAEAREPMGQAKIDHIRAMLKMERIGGLWQQRFGRAWTEDDVHGLYERFLPLQKEVLADHATVIPGVAEAIAQLRSRGLKIGSTTGYTRALMDVVEPLAAAQGVAPDATICSDQVSAGRPAPWQNFRAAEQLGIYPMRDVLVADDSLAGIEAGLHAGCFTVAVAMTGNALGVSLEAFLAIPPERRLELAASIRSMFVAAGAHAIVESVADLPSFWNAS